MFHVQTVSGPIAPDALGHSQIHEHIFVHRTPMAEKNPALRLDDPARSLEELRAYRAAGGGFLADAQPVAAGRDAERLGALSRESGVAVAASTGYHLLGFYPADCWVHSLDEEGLYDLYCGELLEGMLPWRPEPDRRPAQPTAFRAGLVKAAIPAEGAEGRYAVLLRAAARAAVRCGVPLMLHTERGENTLPALELCFRAGLTPERLIVCHVDRQAADFGPHDAIAATGVYLDYDTIGRFKYHSDEEEVALLRHMCERGYTQRMLLSLDTTAQRMALLAGQALTVARSLLWPLLASAAVCAALYLIKKQPVTVGRLLNLWAAFATVQCLLRAVKDGSLDERQFVPVVVLAGAWAFWRGRGRPGNAELFWLGYLPGLAAYAMILRSTLLGLAPTFMYLTWPAVCGMLALVNHADGGDNAAKSRRAEGVLCLAVMLAFLLVCRVWCVQTTGWKSADITDTPLVRITTGPAKGIYADAKAADMQECLYEALAPYAGQPILQAIGEQHGLGFLMADGTLDVAQASVISGTDSDPRFEQYYTDVPGKTPRVILYDDAEVRDMAEFHSWIEADFIIVDRYTVTHGSASLQVLLVG